MSSGTGPDESNMNSTPSLELANHSAKSSMDFDVPRTPEQMEEGTGPLGFCESADLAFTDIRYRVTALKGGKVDVLKGISGTCRSGRIMALMGASGAGKTSLIDILSGHVRAGVSGKVTVNGQPFKAADFQKRSSYVHQRDVLMDTATVKEAITTAALLRLPQSMSRQEKDERVLRVMQQLELEGCADTLIGDEAAGMKGISGGERRRVSVAIGLVTDPQILLLDEPTSGLDSETAGQLVSCLVRLARCNRTVIASIHQPSSSIMACFDDLMLLSGGRCVYCGPWQASMSYFQSVGWPCPMYTNPADFYLAMTKEAGGLLAKKWASVKAWDRDLKQAQESPVKQKLQISLPNSPLPATPASEGKRSSRTLSFADEDEYIRAGPIAEEVSTSYGPSRFARSPEPPTPGGFSTVSIESCKEAPVRHSPSTSWFFQMRVLVVRFIRNWYRRPMLLYSFLAQYTFAGIFMGLMYFQLGTTRASSIFDRQASLFLVLVALAFTPSNTACSVWDTERQLLRREANSGAYRVSTFFAAKTLVTFPMQAVVTFVYCILMYFIAGYQIVAAKFFIFVATNIVFMLISETLGCICAIVTKTATLGILLSSTILMVLFPFSGFLINYTPVFFRWVSKVSFVTYAYSALLQNEMHGLKTHFDTPGQSTGMLLNMADSQYSCLPTGQHSTTRGPGGNDFTIAGNIGLLIFILVALRFIAFGLLQGAYRFKKL